MDDTTSWVLEAIAEVEGVEPSDLGFTLYDYVDPDALDRLLNDERGRVTVSFKAERYTVTVRSDGTVAAVADSDTVPLHPAESLSR